MRHHNRCVSEGLVPHLRSGWDMLDKDLRQSTQFSA